VIEIHLWSSSKLDKWKYLVWFKVAQQQNLTAQLLYWLKSIQVVYDHVKSVKILLMLILGDICEKSCRINYHYCYVQCLFTPAQHSLLFFCLFCGCSGVARQNHARGDNNSATTDRAPPLSARHPLACNFSIFDPSTFFSFNHTFVVICLSLTIWRP